MSYFDKLYNASYNGIPFAVKSVEGAGGRRMALHTYPFRNGGYPEDLGGKMEKIELRAFLVGDDVAAQADFLRAVCKRGGPGILIHPTRGLMSVTLTDFRTSEAFDHGRQIFFDFEFLLGGKKLFPSLITSTLDSILGSVFNLNSAAGSDFISQVVEPLQNGAEVVASGVETVMTFSAIGGATTKSATNIISLASSIPGSFGRFSSGNTGSGTGSVMGGLASVGGLSAQVQSLSNNAALMRSNTDAAGSSMVSTAGGL